MKKRSEKRAKRFFKIRRPAGGAELLRCHLPGVLVPGFVLLIARVLPRGFCILPRCLFKRISGLPCVFCGFTRAFQSLARGEWLDVIKINPGAALLFTLLGVVFVWNAIALLSGRVIERGRWLQKGNLLLWIGIFGGALLLNWVYRLIRTLFIL